MKKIDARKLTAKELFELRRRAVTAVKNGESPEVVTRTYGLSRPCIYKWMSLFNEGGYKALSPRKRTGRTPKLDWTKIKKLYQIISTNNPLQLKFKFALWTREIIQQVIIQKFKIKLGLSTITRLLKRMGLTCQRPLFKSWHQDQQQRKNWLKKLFPKIKKIAKQTNSEVFFGDEAGIRSDFHSGTTWAPKGKTPVISDSGNRFGINMISAISAQGSMRFMVVEGNVTSEVFIDFLKRLISQMDRNIILIVDGHPVHKSKKVKDYISSIKGKLRLFYLPPYSPDLNPDEYVWNELKNSIIGRSIVENKCDLKNKAISGLRSIQKSKNKVRSYFTSKTTKYAA